MADDVAAESTSSESSMKEKSKFIKLRKVDGGVIDKRAFLSPRLLLRWPPEIFGYIPTGWPMLCSSKAASGWMVVTLTQILVEIFETLIRLNHS